MPKATSKPKNILSPANIVTNIIKKVIIKPKLFLMFFKIILSEIEIQKLNITKMDEENSTNKVFDAINPQMKMPNNANINKRKKIVIISNVHSLFLSYLLTNLLTKLDKVNA